MSDRMSNEAELIAGLQQFLNNGEGDDGFIERAIAYIEASRPTPSAGNDVTEEMRFQARQTGDAANAMADWELDAINLSSIVVMLLVWFLLAVAQSTGVL